MPLALDLPAGSRLAASLCHCRCTSVPPSQHCRCRARAVTAGPLQHASSLLGPGVRAFWPAPAGLELPFKWPEPSISEDLSVRAPAASGIVPPVRGTVTSLGVSSNRLTTWFFVTPSPKKPQSQVWRARIPDLSGGQSVNLRRPSSGSPDSEFKLPSTSKPPSLSAPRFGGRKSRPEFPRNRKAAQCEAPLSGMIAPRGRSVAVGT